MAIALCVLCAAVGVAGSVVWTAKASRHVEVSGAEETPVLAIQADGLRYEFHTLTGTESLWDIHLAPDARRNLLRDRPADAERLRRRMLDELGVDRLETLRASQSGTVERLRALGYL